MQIMRVPMLTEGHHATAPAIECVAATKRDYPGEQGGGEQDYCGYPRHAVPGTYSRSKGRTR